LIEVIKIIQIIIPSNKISSFEQHGFGENRMANKIWYFLLEIQFVFIIYKKHQDMNRSKFVQRKQYFGKSITLVDNDIHIVSRGLRSD